MFMDLELLANKFIKSEIWFIDFKCKSTPKLFHQIFIICIIKNEKYILLFYCKIKDKNHIW